MEKKMEEIGNKKWIKWEDGNWDVGMEKWIKWGWKLDHSGDWK